MSKLWDDLAILIEQDERRTAAPEQPGTVYSQYEWEKYREHMAKYTHPTHEQSVDGREVS
jgi:hypothetical protein